jgi:sec-independent protein translocase protein TatA
VQRSPWGRAGAGVEASTRPKEEFMGLSWWHVVLVAVFALLLFGGRGKISDLMGDVAKGIRSFRQGLNEPDESHKVEGREDVPSNKDQTVGR